MSKFKRTNIDDLNNEGVINLLEAFVAFIHYDYVRLYKEVLRRPNDESVLKNLNYIRGLLVSNYFCQLTGLDGKEVLEMLDYECKTKYRGLAEWQISTRQKTVM